MMQTYLLVSSNPAFIENKIADFKKKFTITPFAYHEIIPAPSIGIEQVRQLKQIFALKPFGGRERLVVVRHIEKATITAQNAFLKLLEEPPVDTYIILTATSKEQLLPTVVSRSQIINDANFLPVNQVDLDKTSKLIKKIIASGIGERIQLSLQLSKTREDTVVALDLLIATLRHLLYQPDEKIQLSTLAVAACLKKTMAAKNYVEKNVNYKATLDILFLGFPTLQIGVV